MRPGRAADHSPPSSAAVTEEYSYTSTHPLGHTGPVMGSLYLQQSNIGRQVSTFLLATKPLRVNRGIALHFLGPRHEMVVGDQPHAPAASTPGKDPFSIGWVPGPV